MEDRNWLILQLTSKALDDSPERIRSVKVLIENIKIDSFMIPRVYIPIRTYEPCVLSVILFDQYRIELKRKSVMGPFIYQNHV